MPFIDLNICDSLEPYADNDFVIIGAGAAGILLSVKLSAKGYKVLLIESGHFFISEEKQHLNKIINANKILSTAVEGRIRAIGGTTLKWGGQSLPFSKIDFEKRPWIPLSGWPIDYNEIASYYNEANSFMNIDTMDYGEEVLKKLRLKKPEFYNDIFDYHVSKWAPQPDFKKIYNKELDKKVTILYNALFKKMKKGHDSKIESICLVNFEHKTFSLKTKQLILTAGAIETVRLLLNNKNEINNVYNTWLGKGFMEHPCIYVGNIKPKKSRLLQKKFNTHFYSGRNYSIRLSLNEKLQREKQLLNCSASIMFESDRSSGFDPYAEIKNLRKKISLKAVVKLLRVFPSVANSAYTLLVNGFVYKPNALVRLVLMIEQEPQKESFITLSNENDIFEMPKVELHWKISHKSWETAVITSKYLKDEIERLGLGKVNLKEEIYLDYPNWNKSLSDVNHHMGGCRMSKTSDAGVVDTNLKVWNVDNLFVCSSAVFPTGSHSNPTLTIMALGCRLAEYLSVFTN